MEPKLILKDFILEHIENTYLEAFYDRNPGNSVIIIGRNIKFKNTININWTDRTFYDGVNINELYDCTQIDKLFDIDEIVDHFYDVLVEYSKDNLLENFNEIKEIK